jgi:hypothetical protein
MLNEFIRLSCATATAHDSAFVPMLVATWDHLAPKPPKHQS